MLRRRPKPKGGGFGLKESVHAYATAMRKRLKAKFGPGLSMGAAGEKKITLVESGNNAGAARPRAALKAFAFNLITPKDAIAAVAAASNMRARLAEASITGRQNVPLAPTRSERQMSLRGDWEGGKQFA